MQAEMGTNVSELQDSQLQEMNHFKACLLNKVSNAKSWFQQ